MIKNLDNLLIKFFNGGDRRQWVWPNYSLDDPFGKESTPIHADPILAWSFLKGYYGRNFNLQLIKFKTSTYKPEYNFKKVCYSWQLEKDDWIWYKYMWLINDYYLNDRQLKYPIQMNYHYRRFMWRAHPGVLRYNMYHIDGKKDFDAFYQPVSNKKVDLVKQYFELDEIINDYDIDSNRIWIKLCWFYNKPYTQINLFYTHDTLGHHVDYWKSSHKNIFEKNIEDGIFISCNSKVENLIKEEIKAWPNQNFANKIKFERGPKYIHLDYLDKENLYYGLLLFGTTLNSIDVNNVGLYYQTS
jgi:hypothetical protein